MTDYTEFFEDLMREVARFNAQKGGVLRRRPPEARDWSFGYATRCTSQHAREDMDATILVRVDDAQTVTVCARQGVVFGTHVRNGEHGLTLRLPGGEEHRGGVDLSGRHTFPLQWTLPMTDRAAVHGVVLGLAAVAIEYFLGDWFTECAAAAFATRFRGVGAAFSISWGDFTVAHAGFKMAVVTTIHDWKEGTVGVNVWPKEFLAPYFDAETDTMTLPRVGLFEDCELDHLRQVDLDVLHAAGETEPSMTYFQYEDDAGRYAAMERMCAFVRAVARLASDAYATRPGVTGRQRAFLLRDAPDWY